MITRTRKVAAWTIIMAMLLALIPSAVFADSKTVDPGTGTITINVMGDDNRSFSISKNTSSSTTWEAIETPYSFDFPLKTPEGWLNCRNERFLMTGSEDEHSKLADITITGSSSGTQKLLTSEFSKNTTYIKGLAWSTQNNNAFSIFLNTTTGALYLDFSDAKTLDLDEDITIDLHFLSKDMVKNAKKEITQYKDVKAYRELQKEQYQMILDNGNALIDKAFAAEGEEQETIDEIVALTKTLIDNLKTDAMLTDEEEGQRDIQAEKRMAEAKRELQKKLSGISAKAAPGTAAAAKVSWNKILGADGYKIYRASGKNGSYKAIKTVTGGSYTDKSVKANRTYYYKVRAYSKANCENVYGSYSQSASVKTGPAAPSKLKAKTSKNKVRLSWKKAAGASKYQVYRATKKSGKYKKAGQSSKAAYTDKKLKKGKTYYYKVRAYKKVNGKFVYSSYSKTLRVKIK